MFPQDKELTLLAASPCTRLSRAQSTISESDFHRSICLPLDVPRAQHTPALGRRPRWISQVPDASVSIRAVRSDPAEISGGLAINGRLLLPSGGSIPSALGRCYHEAQPLHLRYGLDVALSTLNSCRYLHEPKTRFLVERLHSLPGRESHPLKAPSLAWRTEALAHVRRLAVQEDRDGGRNAQHDAASTPRPARIIGLPKTGITPSSPQSARTTSATTVRRASRSSAPTSMRVPQGSWMQIAGIAGTDPGPAGTIATCRKVPR
jgi:hypothetical protein